MDPLTQAGLGAAVAASLSKGVRIRTAIAVGALAGAAPDLDILIRSNQDALLSLEYHRHFSHSLLVAPIIGFAVAFLYYLIFSRDKVPLLQLTIFGIAGATTHGLLDACTSYGTRLYWPFSQLRESWDIISIIDPIFSLPLLLLTFLSFFLRRPNFARIACLLCGLYFCFGLYQKEQAKTLTKLLARERGHDCERLSVRPSFANTILWRTLYQSGAHYYVDALRIVPGQEPVRYQGESVPFFGKSQLDSWTGKNPLLAIAVDRFAHFSQGYLYQPNGQPEVLADLRYSILPNSTKPLWGITIPSQPNTEQVDFVTFRRREDTTLSKFFSMLRGE